MKKWIYPCAIALLMAAVAACNNDTDSSKVDPATPGSRKETTTVRDTAIKPLDRYLHLNDDNIIKDPATTESKAALEPYNKKTFRVDSARFADSFFKAVKPRIPRIARYTSFKFSVKSFFDIIQTKLGASTETSTADIYNGLRLYPAFDSTNREFYLAVLYEKTTVEADGTLRKFVDTSNYMGIIKNNLSITTIRDAPRKSARIHMGFYRRMWNRTLNLPKDSVIRNLGFSIAKFNEMLRSLDPAMLEEQNNNNETYYLQLIPCLSDLRQLYFVVKGWGPQGVMEGKDFYNHMDPCPNDCPNPEFP